MKAVRVNILLERGQLKRLKSVARRNKVSVSWFIRHSLEMILPQFENGKKRPPGRRDLFRDPLLQILGIYKGPTRSRRS
jgi:hypothetical protein